MDLVVEEKGRGRGLYFHRYKEKDWRNDSKFKNTLRSLTDGNLQPH
jgi:hypothetical protein